jgi:hypothetical protein
MMGIRVYPLEGDPDLLLAALAELSDEELDSLEAMTKLPGLWPAEYVGALPSLRDAIARHRYTMSIEEVTRRIGM